MLNEELQDLNKTFLSHELFKSSCLGIESLHCLRSFSKTYPKEDSMHCGTPNQRKQMLYATIFIVTLAISNHEQISLQGTHHMRHISFYQLMLK